MLVVIGIIALLASTVVIGLGSARSKARDQRRLEDLKQIQNYMEIEYYTPTKGYPPPSEFLSLTSNGTLPHDPQGGDPYYYCQRPDGQAYVVGALLENATGVSLNGTLPCDPADQDGNPLTCQGDPNAQCIEGGVLSGS